MLSRQYNEMMRQAEVLERDAEDREIQRLWKQFRDENPNNEGTHMDQFISFLWLFRKMKENHKDEK